MIERRDQSVVVRVSYILDRRWGSQVAVLRKGAQSLAHCASEAGVWRREMGLRQDVAVERIAKRQVCGIDVVRLQQERRKILADVSGVAEFEDGVTRKLLLYLEAVLRNHAVAPEAGLNVLNLRDVGAIAGVLAWIQVHGRQQRCTIVQVEHRVEPVAALLIAGHIAHEHIGAVTAKIGVQDRRIDDRRAASNDGPAVGVAG